MTDTGDYSEVSQLRTRCTILESQIQVLETQNAELKATITILHPDAVSSKDKKMTQWKDVGKVGKFPFTDDDGSCQV